MQHVKNSGGSAAMKLLFLIALLSGLDGRAGAEPIEFNEFINRWGIAGPYELTTSALETFRGARLPSRFATEQPLEGTALPLRFLLENPSCQTHPPGNEFGIIAGCTVNFNYLFGRADAPRYAVARTTVDAGSTMTVRLASGFDERAIVYLNDEKVGSFTGDGMAIYDSAITECHLVQGTNTLTVVSFNTRQEWGFFSRFVPTDDDFNCRLIYHLNPLPPGISDIPEARVKLLSADGTEITSATVNGWRDRQGRGLYDVKLKVGEKVAQIEVDMARPYLGLNFRKVFPVSEGKEFAVGYPGTLGIFGEIVDSVTSAPLPDVSVSLAEQLRTTSDQAGSFRLDPVDPAYSILKFEAPGYKPLLFDYDFANREPIPIALQPL